MKHITKSSIKTTIFENLIDASTATEFVSKFYSLMTQELDDAGFTPGERLLMEDPVYYYGRYLNPVTRPYFEETVGPIIGNALLWLGQPHVKCVLDLGCGLAMQSIIFAALGKKVIAVDLRPEAIEIGKKRKRYYERLLGREFEIEFVCGDFRSLDLTAYTGSIDGIFSMSAFSYIQPIENTVSLLADLSAPDARLFLFEENASSIVAKVFNRRIRPAPSVVVDKFDKHGFTKHSLSGTCALPKQLWVYPGANGYIRRLDETLRKSMLLAFSYALLMERKSQLAELADLDTGQRKDEIKQVA